MLSSIALACIGVNKLLASRVRSSIPFSVALGVDPHSITPSDPRVKVGAFPFFFPLFFFQRPALDIHSLSDAGSASSISLTDEIKVQSQRGHRHLA